VGIRSFLIKPATETKGPGNALGPYLFEIMSNTDCYATEKKLTSLDDAILVARSLADAVSGVVVMDTLYAAGRVLAADITSPLPLPPFDQSAMDGYAVFVPEDGVSAGTRFSLKGRLAAGDDSSAHPGLKVGEAYRVFTGAPLPSGANAVIMQEHCTVKDECISINASLQNGDNIRGAGEDIKSQQLVLRAGTKLDPRHVAVLSAMGIAKVTVKRKLRVGIMLMAALKRPGLEVEDYGRAGDDATAIQSKLAQCASAVDLIVTTGSAGGSDTDLLFRAAQSAGGTAQLLKLALKPGKPCIMGRIGQAAFLGLPGNPVAALVTFLMFGEATVAALLGMDEEQKAFITVHAASRYRHVQGKTEFVPARLVANGAGLPKIEIVGKGGSARYLPLLMADGLCMIETTQGNVEAGTMLSFLPFRSLSWR
jgi:molybdopterin molybdotransferase